MSPRTTSRTEIVLARLPADYMLNDRDLRLRNVCDGLLDGEPTNESAVAATEAALKAHPDGHIDPFELLIDAEICDTMCRPM